MSIFSYSLYELLCMFVVYGFIGWSVEVIYAATVHGKFVNRGFCAGPICPIYGIGAVFVILLLSPIREQWFLLYICSVVFTSFIEFIVGLLLERFFHEKWWDYTDEPFNLMGYVCLKFSLLWGLACVLVVRIIQPTVIAVIDLIPSVIGYIFIATVAAVFLTDLSITCMTLLKIRHNLKAIIEIEVRLELLSNSIGSNLSDTTLVMMEQGERLKDNKNVEKIKFAVTDKMHSLEDVYSNISDNISDKLSETEALREKLILNVEAMQKRSNRIFKAFPNIISGKYRHIFKK